MRRGGIDLEKIVQLGKSTGYITEGLVAWWTGKGGSTAYLAFRQLRQLCEDRVLDDDETVCVVRGDKIVFLPRGAEE